MGKRSGTNLGKLIVLVLKVGTTITTLLLSAHGIAYLPVMAVDDQVEREEKRSKRSFRRSARGVVLKLRTMRTLADSTEDLSSEGEEDDERLLVVAQEDAVASPDKEITWPGKDFVNFIVKDVAEPDVHEADNSDRVKTPRMPWHDVGLVVQGDTARDVAR